MSRTRKLPNRHERRAAAKLFPFPVNTEATKRLEQARREGLIGTPPKTPPAQDFSPVSFTIAARNGQVTMEFDRPIVIFGMSPTKTRELAEILRRAADSLDVSTAVKTAARKTKKKSNGE